jgi:hypothetical protein
MWGVYKSWSWSAIVLLLSVGPLLVSYVTDRMWSMAIYDMCIYWRPHVFYFVTFVVVAKLTMTDRKVYPNLATS